MTRDSNVTVVTWLATTLLMLAFVLVLIFYLRTIGGTTVPAVHCQEDEVISWLGRDRLGCVHYEEVK